MDFPDQRRHFRLGHLIISILYYLFYDVYPPTGSWKFTFKFYM